MPNIKSNFDKIYQTIKSLNLDFFDERGNVPKPGSKPPFSDPEVVSLALTAKYMSSNSKN